MNILFCSSDNNATSGAFLCMVKLCTLLKEKYNHNILVVLPVKGDGAELLKNNNIKYYVVRSFGWIYKKNTNTKKIFIEKIIKKTLNWFSINKISKIIKKNNIELVHINTTYSYVGAIAAKNNGIPYYWHIREYIKDYLLWSEKDTLDLMKGAKKVIAVSNRLYREYEDKIASDNVELIWDGIDAKEFYKSNHQILQNETEIKLLMVGGFGENKGQKQLIEACAIMNEKFKNYSLTFIGQTNNRYGEECEKRVDAYGLNNNIVFLGRQTNVSQYYNQSDIVFVCSESEAFGRVTVEGMLSGALVIGANTSATKELIKDGETGFLYEWNNYNSLANIIDYAINNIEKSKTIAKAGQTFAYNQLTAEKNAEKVNEVYYK